MLAQPATFSGQSISSILTRHASHFFPRNRPAGKPVLYSPRYAAKEHQDTTTQGMRLPELRKDAGLSQYELARYVGVPQANIAFWERSEKPPRSEVLPKMAEALGVSVEDLLIVGGQKPLKKKAVKSNGRPAGKVREVFNRVSKLPRRQQDHIVNWVSAYVSHYEQTKLN